MNHIKMLANLRDEIFKIETWPQHRDTENGEGNYIYDDFYPINEDNFFILLSELWNKTDEKERLIDTLVNYGNRLFNHINSDRHHLNENDIDRILKEKNNKNGRDFFIFNTFHFACEIMNWAEKKKDEITNDQAKTLEYFINGGQKPDKIKNPVIKKCGYEIQNYLLARFYLIQYQEDTQKISKSDFEYLRINNPNSHGKDDYYESIYTKFSGISSSNRREYINKRGSLMRKKSLCDILKNLGATDKTMSLIELDLSQKLQMSN